MTEYELGALGPAFELAIEDKVRFALSHGQGYHDIARDIDSIIVQTAMMLANQNQTKAAEMLKLNRGTFRKKLKEAGVNK